MSLAKTLRFITTHPLNRRRRARAMLGFLRWQIASRVARRDIVYEWVGGAKFLARTGETGLTGNIYCGLHEFQEMAFVLHATTPDDLFVDVGANVGAYTLLACAVRGARGVCFEPAPETFQRLTANLRLNDLTNRVVARRTAVSNYAGNVGFTSSKNCMNHVVATSAPEASEVRLEADTLDSMLAGAHPTIIKIDVEGFESAVLAGAGNTLQSKSLHAVILELNGSGARYGYSDADVLETMVSAGFEPFEYDPISRNLNAVHALSGMGNVLFLKHVAKLKERLASADAFYVKNIAI